MGQVLLISLPWDDPITLQRAWCIFEVYSCIAKDAKFDIAMTKQEEDRFLKNIAVNHCIAFYDMLGRIKSENSECFLDNDRVEIFGAINKILPNGFITLDSILFRTIEKWIEDVIKRQISNAITKGDVDSESTWNNILGTLYCQQGYYDEAEKHFIKATATGSNDKQITLRAISGFASLLELQGKYNEACELYQKCLKDSSDLYGPDDPLTLTCLNDVADIYRRLELDEEAEYLYLDCIKRRTSLLGEDSFELITSKNNLAGLYKDNLRYSEAIQLYNDCLSASKESHDHPLVTTIVSNISVIYQLLEDYDEALNLCKQVYDNSRRVFGDRHPSTLQSLYQMAMIHEYQKNFVLANTEYKECIQISAEVVGIDHPDTIAYILSQADMLVDISEMSCDISSLFPNALKDAEELYRLRVGDSNISTSNFNAWNNVGVCLFKQGLYENALPIFCKCLENITIDYDAIKFYNNFIELYINLCQYENAEKLCNQQMKLLEDLNMEDTSDYFDSMLTQSRLLRYQQRNNEAVMLLHQIIQWVEDNGDDDHHLEILAKNNLATLYMEIDDNDSSGPLLAECLELNLKHNGPNHPETLIAITNLALFYESHNIFSNAEVMLLDVYKKRQIHVNADTYSTTLNLAIMYEKMGLNDESENFYKRALEIAHSLYGTEHINLLIPLQNLADFYSSNDSNEKAISLYKQYISIATKLLGADHDNTIKGKEMLQLLSNE